MVGVPPPSFQLFVAGSSATAIAAIALLQRVCGARFGNGYELEVVDVLARPDLADAAHVIATPTLLCHRPAPLRRVVGDLTALDAFLDEVLGGDGSARGGSRRGGTLGC